MKKYYQINIRAKIRKLPILFFISCLCIGCSSTWKTVSLIYLGSAIGYLFIGGDKFAENVKLEYLNEEDQIIEISNDSLYIRIEGLYVYYYRSINLLFEFENRLKKEYEIKPDDFKISSEYFNITNVNLIESKILDFSYSLNSQRNKITIPQMSKLSFVLVPKGDLLKTKNNGYIKIYLANNIYDSNIIIKIKNR